MHVLVLNGPNLNLLGLREPEIYGQETLADVERSLRRAFPDVQFTWKQSNHEGVLIDALQDARSVGKTGIVFNPGAYTHTSVALRDAVAAIRLTVVEVHLSNIHAREDFRQRSLLTPVCAGQISGLGTAGYHLAVRYLTAHASS